MSKLPDKEGLYYWRYDSGDAWGVLEVCTVGGVLYANGFEVSCEYGEWGPQVPAPELRAALVRILEYQGCFCDDMTPDYLCTGCRIQNEVLLFWPGDDE